MFEPIGYALSNKKNFINRCKVNGKNQCYIITAAYSFSKSIYLKRVYNTN